MSLARTHSYIQHIRRSKEAGLHHKPDMHPSWLSKWQNQNLSGDESGLRVAEASMGAVSAETCSQMYPNVMYLIVAVFCCCLALLTLSSGENVARHTVFLRISAKTC